MANAAEIVAFLRGVRLFRDIPAPDLAALAGNLREHTLRKSQVLFREGDRGDAMYLLLRGTMIVSKAVTGRVDQILARFGPGDFFGEMSLFDRSPRSATMQADTDVTLLTLDRQHLSGSSRRTRGRRPSSSRRSSTSSSTDSARRATWSRR